MIIRIDELIHQPIRTKIMAFLGAHKRASYSEIKKSLELTDGHMSTHVKKLIEGKYIKATKKFIKNKPLTNYELTKLGKDNLIQYLKDLNKLVNF